MNRIVILGRPGFELPHNILQLLEQIVSKQNNHVDVIDETEATPVLEDVPEDPEVTIETLQARALHLEAELEEHRRSVDSVLEALRPLGTIVEPEVVSEFPATDQSCGPTGHRHDFFLDKKGRYVVNHEKGEETRKRADGPPLISK